MDDLETRIRRAECSRDFYRLTGKAQREIEEYERRRRVRRFYVGVVLLITGAYVFSYYWFGDT